MSNKIWKPREWDLAVDRKEVTEKDLHIYGDEKLIAIGCPDCGSKMYDCRKKGTMMKIDCDNCEFWTFRKIARE